MAADNAIINVKNTDVSNPPICDIGPDGKKHIKTHVSNKPGTISRASSLFVLKCTVILWRLQSVE